MAMHNRLIVGFDGSENSRTALRWAAAEAEVRQASVSAVSSYAMPPIMNLYGIGTAGAAATALERLGETCTESLHLAVAESAARHPSVHFDEHVVVEQPVDYLVGATTDADLVVVGANGLGAVKHFLLGSVTGALLHKSACPIVVVPAALGTQRNRVIVGVDSSHSSNAALQFAADEADRLSSELLVVHAWQYPYTISGEGASSRTDLCRVDAALVLDEAVEFARDRMAGNVVRRLVDANAAQALLDASAEGDMLVVGSRGRGGFRSMLLGSVAHAVSVNAPCPVVVVR